MVLFKNLAIGGMFIKPVFKYKKIDKRNIPNKKDEIRLFAIARNESMRLPYFLRYYFEKEIDRIFLIDNNSDDDSLEIALAYPNVHVFKIDEGYKNHWNWMEYFLDKYANGHWTLVVDIDELLNYPYSEYISIKKLTKYLDLSKRNALRSLLLDIYSDKPIINTFYKQNENPLMCCPYFDSQYNTCVMKQFDRKKWIYFNSIEFYGGMRERVFNKLSINNTPFKYHKNIFVQIFLRVIPSTRNACFKWGKFR